VLSLSDSSIARIETVECGEDLVELRTVHERLFVDDSEANAICIGYRPIFLTRKSVAVKLRQAVQSMPVEFALLVKDAFRPPCLQQQFFSSYIEQLKATNSELSGDHLIALASRFVAPPDVAGHPTGGAIDLTLCTRSGEELDLGGAYDEDGDASNGACFSSCNLIGEAEKRHRKILFLALERVGLVNYPFEWWHWSYGDKYWAAVSGAESAVYGPLHAPEGRPAIVR
jgi:D-alanyl-D-alanine dipeptidase